MSTPRSAGAWASSASTTSRPTGLSGPSCGTGADSSATGSASQVAEVPLARRQLVQDRPVARGVLRHGLHRQVHDAYAVGVDLEQHPSELLGEAAGLGDRHAVVEVAAVEQVVGVTADDDVDQAAQVPADRPVGVDTRVAEQHHDVGPSRAQVCCASRRTAVLRGRSDRPKSAYWWK